jgi:hypothetical protein
MAKFLELLLASPEVKPLLSSEHFSVDLHVVAYNLICLANLLSPREVLA